MSDSFFDDLMALVVGEMRAARKAGDEDRLSGVVAGLAEVLGKTIAIIGNGNPVLIDKMLTAADGLVVETATEVGGFISTIQNLVKESVRK